MSAITLPLFDWFQADRPFLLAPAQEEETYEEHMVLLLGCDPAFAHWCAEKARQVAQEDAL